MSKKPKPPKVVWVVCDENGKELIPLYIGRTRREAILELGNGVAEGDLKRWGYTVHKYTREEPCQTKSC